MNDYTLAKHLLEKSGVSILSVAKLVCHILDSRYDSADSNDTYCRKVLRFAAKYYRPDICEQTLAEGFKLYLQRKTHLRETSLRDIRYLGNRLFRKNPQILQETFYHATPKLCEEWLARAFQTPSQFNKGRAMLHGLFSFAVRMQWCAENPVCRVERRKVIEREILPLKIADVCHLLNTAANLGGKDVLLPVAIMLWTGIRPAEVGRLRWSDIDLRERSITIRSICSKTGGVRHVEIPAVLSRLLRVNTTYSDAPVCVRNWRFLWRKVRIAAGFKDNWIPDVLRHTFASYFLKYFANLAKLQILMGHSNATLLRARYVNMRGISKQDCKAFWSLRLCAAKLGAVGASS